MKKIVAALVLSLILAGCAQQPQQPTGQITGTVPATEAANVTEAVSMPVVENGDSIKTEYAGSFEDGTIFDKSEGRGPLEFVVGAGQMIKGFDEAVVGMKLNEEKNVSIAPEKAYGAVSEDAFKWVPKSQMPPDVNVVIGTKLMTSSGMPVEVVDVNADSVKVNFNHPLAGKTLKFWIKVVSVQKAKK